MLWQCLYHVYCCMNNVVFTLYLSSCQRFQLPIHQVWWRWIKAMKRNKDLNTMRLIFSVGNESICFVSLNFSIDFPPIIFYLSSYYTAIFFYFRSSARSIILPLSFPSATYRRSFAQPLPQKGSPWKSDIKSFGENADKTTIWLITKLFLVLAIFMKKGWAKIDEWRVGKQLSLKVLTMAWIFHISAVKALVDF